MFQQLQMYWVRMRLKGKKKTSWPSLPVQDSLPKQLTCIWKTVWILHTSRHFEADPIYSSEKRQSTLTQVLKHLKNKTWTNTRSSAKTGDTNHWKITENCSLDLNYEKERQDEKKKEKASVVFHNSRPVWPKQWAILCFIELTEVTEQVNVYIQIVLIITALSLCLSVDV